MPLVILGVWIWEATPEDDARSGGDGRGGPEALAVSFSRPGPGRISVAYSNDSKRKITVVVPGRPGGVLRIVKAGVPAGPPRSLAFDAERDARVELLPGATYNQLYRTNAAGRIEVIYDARGAGLPAGTWRGIARSGTPSGPGGGKGDTNGG